MSSEQAQKLNRDLSTKTLKDIPKERRKDVEQFLCTQLMHNLVEPELISSLDTLLLDIQKNA
jgi:hypothetical protein